MLSKPQIRFVQKSLVNEEDRLALAFQALGDTTRLKIMRLLSKRKDICVTDVANIMKVSVPAASHQLKFMEMAGLVKRERTGKTICYCVRRDNPFVRKLLNVI